MDPIAILKDTTVPSSQIDGTLFIAMPSRGNISIDLLTAYMGLQKPKHYFLSTNIVPLDAARNDLVAKFLTKTPDATHIIFWDDDIIPNPGDLAKLWSHNEPIVSGLYFKKQPPHEPLMSLTVRDVETGEDGMTHLIDWEENKPYYVDGVGMGFCLIRRDVFQDIPPPWFKFGFLSEDYNFCVKAKEYGYKIKVDTSVKLTHISDRSYVNNDLFRRYQQDEIRKKTVLK